MTGIDFYRIEGDDERARDRFACRLVEKVYKLGQSVFVQARDAAHARAFDELLWVWRQGSFVPHELAGSDLDPQCPVLIAHDLEPDGHPHEVLINLDAAVPPFAASFERVAEIVCDQPEVRDAGRRKYRHYKERGFPLRYHDLTRTEG